MLHDLPIKEVEHLGELCQCLGSHNAPIITATSLKFGCKHNLYHAVMVTTIKMCILYSLKVPATMKA